MFKFSKTSEKKLGTCERDLQIILEEALKISDIDFGVSEGYRSLKRQKALFNAKPQRTKIDGVNKKGKHNFNPSKAVDIFVAGIEDNYSKPHLIYLAGIILTVAKYLKLQNKITSRIRWGGNWDEDNEIINDQSFDDLVHYEII